LNDKQLQRRAAELADQIEAEMRRIGIWRDTAPSPNMAFSQWLQFVFLLRVRDAIAANDLPASSSVAARAVREFDGMDEADDLIGLLVAFDGLIMTGEA
jgi:uncharacterized protein YqcC (DUF446 family)